MTYWRKCRKGSIACTYVREEVHRYKMRLLKRQAAEKLFCIPFRMALAAGVSTGMQGAVGRVLTAQTCPSVHSQLCPENHHTWGKGMPS